MYRQLHKATKITKSQRNLIPPKEYSNWPKDREIQELPNREFKIIIKGCSESYKTIQINNVTIAGKQYKNKIGSKKR